MPELTEYRITLLNGVCKEKTLMEAAGGIRYGSLRTAMTEMGSVVKDLLLEVSVNRDKSAADDRNAAEADDRTGAAADCSTGKVNDLDKYAIPVDRDGAFVYVPEGVKASGVFIVESRVIANAAGNAETGTDAIVRNVATDTVILLRSGASAAVTYEVRIEESGLSCDAGTEKNGADILKNAKLHEANTALHVENKSTECAPSYGSDSEGVSLTESRIVSLGEGASLRFEDTVFCNGGKIAIDNYSRLEADAVLNAVTVELSGGGEPQRKSDMKELPHLSRGEESRNKFDRSGPPHKSGEASFRYGTDLAGRNSRTTHAGLFVIDNQERAGFDITVRHLVTDCHSDVIVKGVAGGQARGSFSGLVYVAQDAQHTQAYQQSRNLLLSDTARITTSPQLEIHADDVKCSHGATVGQQDGEAIYYMRQRGLSEEQARRLQMTGFVNDIISRLSNENRRKEILTHIKLDNGAI